MYFGMLMQEHVGVLVYVVSYFITCIFWLMY
jgi:hypothetical protein